MICNDLSQGFILAPLLYCVPNFNFCCSRESKTFVFNSETSPLAAGGGYLGPGGVGGGQDNCPKITSARGWDQGAPFLRKWGEGGHN